MKDIGLHRISIVGYGNVGSHLLSAFKDSGVEVSHLLVRNIDSLDDQANDSPTLISKPDELPNHQLALLCVKDDAIGQLLENINETIPVAYTSGSVSINELPSREQLGVFYPLQTFTKGKKLSRNDFPVLIEGTNEQFESHLIRLGQAISNNVRICNSEDRSKIHEVAVWVNNFTNHIIYLAEKRSNELSIDFSLFKPLLSETIEKLAASSAFEAQTGPARRGDKQIIRKQLEGLKGVDADIYELLTQSILNTYKSNEKL